MSGKRNNGAWLRFTHRKQPNHKCDSPNGSWLTLKSLSYLLSLESHDDRTVNDDDRSGHVAECLEIGEGPWIMYYVSLLKGQDLLRKILLRLVAEHSPMLRINHDVLRHSPPPAGLVPVASNALIDSLAPLITSRTGPSE
jgi:hypothetical protein